MVTLYTLSCLTAADKALLEAHDAILGSFDSMDITTAAENATDLQAIRGEILDLTKRLRLATGKLRKRRDDAGDKDSPW